jgi:hypothetical protein
MSKVIVILWMLNTVKVMPVNLGFSAFLLALLSIEQSVMTKTPVGN